MINDPLKRMVEYLKAVSGPETSIIAVEYARRTQGILEMLMAYTYGEELSQAKGTATRERIAWDAEATWRPNASLAALAEESVRG